MNAKIERKINGLNVSAKPVFKGGVLPAYWACAIDELMIDRTFESAREVFRFAEKLHSPQQSIQ